MAVARRTRRLTKAAGPVEELKGLVDSLIKENQKLKRQLLARMESKTVGIAATTATKGLTAITRRLERALGSSSPGRKSSGKSSTSAARSRRSTTAAPKARKPASPETQAKRLAALARAREARAAKKAATSS
jgi:hypothetical protein